MAQLYFKYGAMGSRKTANALMTRFNYEERGQKTLLVKPRLDTRDGDHQVVSRIGLTHPCIYFDELQALGPMELQQNACVIVDEAQFLTREEVMYLVGLVDDLGIPVICYGLRADFKGDLFPGSEALLVMADKIEEVKTICWCGKKATFNARFDAAGKVLKEGEQVVLGATEIDTDFNVNVHTDSNGRIIGGSGGHTDVAEEAKLTVIVAPLTRARMSIVVDKVITTSTPGSSVDLLVTQYGIAVNPARPDLKQKLAAARLPVKDIRELRKLALQINGPAAAYVRHSDRVVAKVMGRDGKLQDEIYAVE